MVKVENLSKRLQRFTLKNITFDLPEGFICGVIGENGAGKTTLMHILSGLYSYEDGEVKIFQKDFKENEYLIKQDIGEVFHGDWFDDRETLLGNADYYGRFYAKYENDKLLAYLKRFQLEGNRKYKSLSKGEKLKFAFAFALSHNPKLLLLDEPSANFDEEFRNEFHKCLREFVSDGTRSVLLSTHLTSDVEYFADYLLFLRKGEQLIFDDIETVRGSYRMVSGEPYKIKLLKERVIFMEQGEVSCKALVKNNGQGYDPALATWEPSIDELMYFMIKGEK